MVKSIAIVAAFLIMISGAPLNGDVIVYEDDFDSYPPGPLPGNGNWTGTCSSVSEKIPGIAPPNTPPNFVMLSIECDAIWEITAPGTISELTLEFYAEFQWDSDPHIYLSADARAWTDVTSAFEIIKGCNMASMLPFSGDLTPFLRQGQSRVFLRWANVAPDPPNCYLIGFDTVTATATVDDSCEAIKRFKADCFFRCRDGRLHIEAVLKSKLTKGTELTLCLDDENDCRTVTTNRRGKAKAKWFDVTPGRHEVFLADPDCPDVRARTYCCD